MLKSTNMQTLIKERVSASNGIPLPASSKHINHIDGLRGIAIILILLFHISKAFPNGYIGVHVFLVISGYFLFRNFWDNNYEFSWNRFCLKKITRLLPCAIVVSFLTCLAALCFLPYDIVLKTAKSAIATIVGFSNIYYDYTYSDYFAASSITNPLVHTWYLGVIIQLYIISGCLMILGKHKSISFKFLVVSILFIASALLYYMPLWIDAFTRFHAPISTYYWTCGHLWMLLAGAYAHLVPKLDSKIPGKALGSAALLLTCMLGLLPLRLTTGHACLIDIAAVCASVTCICYGGTGWSGSVLNSTIVSSAGKVSFSLYLVHWPVISIFAMASASWAHNPPLKLLSLFIIGITTWLLYWAIERRSFDLKSVIAGWAACMVMCIAFAYSNGMRDIVHASVNAIRPSLYYGTGMVRAIESGTTYDSLPDFRQENHRAGFGPMQYIFEKIPLLYQIGDGTKDPAFILIGDSHAEALYPGFDVISQESGWSGVYLHTYVIPFVRYYSEARPYQRWDAEKSEQLLEYLKRNANIRTVFIANIWPGRFGSNYSDSDGNDVDVKLEPEKDYSKFRDYIFQIHSLGKQVVVIRDVPTIPTSAIKNYVWFCRQYNREIDKTLLTATRDQYDKCNKIANECISRLEAEGLCQVLRADDAILQEETFCCYQDGKLYYRDDNHVSLEGSIVVMKYLKETVRSVLESKGGS